MGSMDLMTADTPGVEPSRSWVSPTQTPKAQCSTGDQAGGDDDLAETATTGASPISRGPGAPARP